MSDETEEKEVEKDFDPAALKNVDDILIAIADVEEIPEEIDEFAITGSEDDEDEVFAAYDSEETSEFSY